MSTEKTKMTTDEQITSLEKQIESKKKKISELKRKKLIEDIKKKADAYDELKSKYDKVLTWMKNNSITTNDGKSLTIIDWYHGK